MLESYIKLTKNKDGNTLFVRKSDSEKPKHPSDFANAMIEVDAETADGGTAKVKRKVTPSEAHELYAASEAEQTRQIKASDFEDEVALTVAVEEALAFVGFQEITAAVVKHLQE